jgi:protein AIR1/2
MTSTAVLEIIDLTDSPPSLNNEAQKTPIAAERSVDPDPEKNATRAARKRKNGEAGNGRARSHPPVKSPDGSPERSHARHSGEGTAPHTAEGNNNGEPKARKKRRSKKNNDKEKDSAPPSREDTQHDALLTFDDGELFKVDTVPAAVPEDRTFDPSRGTKAAPSSSSQTPGPDRVPLLLPAHVSVLDPGDDLPVQTIQPAESDSDSESYIEYLDYDDRLVRS